MAWRHRELCSPDSSRKEHTESELDRACSMHGRYDKHIQNWNHLRLPSRKSSRDKAEWIHVAQKWPQWLYIVHIIKKTRSTKQQRFAITIKKCAWQGPFCNSYLISPLVYSWHFTQPLLALLPNEKRPVSKAPHVMSLQRQMSLFFPHRSLVFFQHNPQAFCCTCTIFAATSDFDYAKLSGPA